MRDDVLTSLVERARPLADASPLPGPGRELEAITERMYARGVG